jgi:hypothetical protein
MSWFGSRWTCGAEFLDEYLVAQALRFADFLFAARQRNGVAFSLACGVFDQVASCMAFSFALLGSPAFSKAWLLPDCRFVTERLLLVMKTGLPLCSGDRSSGIGRRDGIVRVRQFPAMAWWAVGEVATIRQRRRETAGQAHVRDQAGGLQDGNQAVRSG